MVGLDIAVLAVVAGLVTVTSSGSAVIVAGSLTVAWLVILALFGAYDPRFLGVGPAEFTRVLTTWLVIVALFATTALILDVDSLRTQVVLAIVASGTVVLLERRVARAWLHHRRDRGGFAVRALVVGSSEHCARLSRVLERDRSSGLSIVCETGIPGSDAATWVDGIARMVREYQVDAIAIAPGSLVDTSTLRALSWRLSGTGTDLLVASNQADLAGPRAVIRSAPRLPFVHLEEAQLTGPQQALKRTGDVIAATTGLVLMAPVLLLVAIVVKATSRGPVLFRQQRVGRDGQAFVIAKFRTMVNGAHRMHHEVLGSPIDRDPQITIRDPRITPLGRFLRRWSLDEFPQLWSVIVGDMSLVGPRPLMPEEMPWLEPFGQRRHVMRPGITGLWQVNGRKELDWADRIRLDVEYVERWSPTLDAVLLLRTVKAVITGDGAR